MKGSKMKTRIHVRGKWGMMVSALVVLGLLAGGCDPMEFSGPGVSPRDNAVSVRIPVYCRPRERT